jgi:hypothetical protein
MSVEPRALASRVRAWRPVLREREVAAWTGLSSSQWQRLARLYPGLPRNPGLRAARARRRLSAFSMRALATGSWAPQWEGAALTGEPAVYATAHVGSLLALRYVLRARGVRVASVIAPYNFDRPDPAAKDALFDRRYPMEFPHVVSSEATHRIRSLLKRGSLILAADLPGRRAFSAPLLGGTVELDPRPFRLARMAGVACIPIFLTVPGRRWTVTRGARLPEGERAAEDAFARAFARAASRAPADLDGPVYWNRFTKGMP